MDAKGRLWTKHRTQPPARTTAYPPLDAPASQWRVTIAAGQGTGETSCSKYAGGNSRHGLTGEALDQLDSSWMFWFITMLLKSLWSPWWEYMSTSFEGTATGGRSPRCKSDSTGRIRR